MFQAFRSLLSTFRQLAEESSEQTTSSQELAESAEFTSLEEPPEIEPLESEPLASEPLEKIEEIPLVAQPVPTAAALSNPAPAVRNSKFDNLKQVLNVLRAYVVTFGQPGSEAELRAVVGAVVANVATVTVENQDLEKFMTEAIAAFKSLGIDASLIDVTAQHLAEQVAVWLKEQETMASNVLSAYLQQFAPDDADWRPENVIALTQTIIATLNDGSLSKSGGRALVNQVVEAFNLDEALSRWVAPEWVALAQQVASYIEKGSLQQEIQSITWAYLQQFEAILSPQLIEQIIRQGPINVSPAELLSRDLTDFSQMLCYKFQLLEADPVVTKSHEAIAADVHRAVANLKARQKPVLDVTTGHQEDLSVYSVFVSPNKPDVG